MTKKYCLKMLAMLLFVSFSTSMPIVTMAQVERQTITVYSARKDHLIAPVFDLFWRATGVKVRFITDKAGALLTRLLAEGENTPADILLTVDAGNLWYAQQRGLLKAVHSEVLEKNIPHWLRAQDNTWFALSKRMRTIVYATERVNPQHLLSYASLADKFWHGKLCLRTSKKIYNQSLVASLIHQYGQQETFNIVRGWVNNFSMQPLSSDTNAIKALLKGRCDVTIVNTYYLGRLLKDNPNAPVAIHWPAQNGHGVHVNISGAGLLRYAKNPQQAVKLLEWLSEFKAQKLFAALNLEYPVNPKVSPTPIVASWGDPHEDHQGIKYAGPLQREAVKIMDKAGYR